MDLAIIPRFHRPLRREGTADPLEARLAGVIAASALRLLDPDRIDALAEDLRVIERRRVHHMGLVVCGLILSALERSTDTEGRWLDAQRTYETLGGPPAGKTAFRRQVRKALPVLQELLRRRLRQLATEAPTVELGGRLRDFANVLIPDGCAFKLASALSGIYPGTGQDSELKLHAVYNVGLRTATTIGVSAGSVHDSDGFHPESWQAGALYLWDLGYNSYARFIDAVRAGAHVLQRFKDGANPIVLASYGPTGGRREIIADDGSRVTLNDACRYGWVHRQSVLDLDVEINDGGRKIIARLVCVPFGGVDRFYLTTLPRDVFSPHDVAEIYRLRWEVELFFRNWKGAVRLDEVHRLKHRDSLLVAVTSSLLAAVFARDITAGLERLVAEDTARQNAFFP